MVSGDPGYLAGAGLPFAVCVAKYHHYLSDNISLFQLLETVIKNCGDILHMHVAERDILHEMVKIVKKKVQCASCL
jgi:hypothetical protein